MSRVLRLYCALFLLSISSFSCLPVPKAEGRRSPAPYRPVADSEPSIARASFASQRAEVVELRDKLESESGKLSQTREKWKADEENLKTAKEALEAAANELNEALGRPIS